MDLGHHRFEMVRQSCKVNDVCREDFLPLVERSKMKKAS